MRRRTDAGWLPWACLMLMLCGMARLEGVLVVFRSSCWLLAEAAAALAIATLMTSVVILLARPQLVAYVNQFTSRGLELAAALPTVLACGAVAKFASLPIPMAVACVIGILGGLHCARAVIFVESGETSDGGPPPSRAPRWTLVHDAISPVLSTLIEQIVGLEAALAWLELYSGDWSGGWGERLGQAARKHDMPTMLLWTATSVCLSVALKSKTIRPPATPLVAPAAVLGE